MTIQSTTPYFAFDGDAAAAIEHYATHLGAEVVDTMPFGPNSPFGPEAAERIMHASLKLGEASIMLSDTPPGHDPIGGGNIRVSIEFDDLPQMIRSFEGLAAEGTVSMALHDSFWGSHFGMLTDRFGIQWMFSGPAKGEASV